MAHWVEVPRLLTISNCCHHQHQTSTGPMEHGHGDLLSDTRTEELSCSVTLCTRLRLSKDVAGRSHIRLVTGDLPDIVI